MCQHSPQLTCFGCTPSEKDSHWGTNYRFFHYLVNPLVVPTSSYWQRNMQLAIEWDVTRACTHKDKYTHTHTHLNDYFLRMKRTTLTHAKWKGYKDETKFFFLFWLWYCDFPYPSFISWNPIINVIVVHLKRLLHMLLVVLHSATTTTMTNPKYEKMVALPLYSFHLAWVRVVLSFPHIL